VNGSQHHRNALSPPPSRGTHH